MSETSYLLKIPQGDARLTMALAHLDRVQSKRVKHWNPWFIGIALQSAEGYEQDAATVGWEAAYADRFTPSREMHRMSKWIGLDLSVDRGRWVLPDGRVQ